MLPAPTLMMPLLVMTLSLKALMPTAASPAVMRPVLVMVMVLPSSTSMPRATVKPSGSPEPTTIVPLMDDGVVEVGADAGDIAEHRVADRDRAGIADLIVVARQDAGAVVAPDDGSAVDDRVPVLHSDAGDVDAAAGRAHDDLAEIGDGVAVARSDAERAEVDGVADRDDAAGGVGDGVVVLAEDADAVLAEGDAAALVMVLLSWTNMPAAKSPPVINPAFVMVLPLFAKMPLRRKAEARG